MKNLTQRIHEKLENFDSEYGLKSRLSSYNEEHIVKRQALLHYTIKLLDSCLHPDFTWLAEMAIFIEYAHILSSIESPENPKIHSLHQQQFIIEKREAIGCSVFLNLRYSNTLFDFNQFTLKLDKEDIHSIASLKIAVIRRILAKCIIDQQLHNEQGVLLIDDNVIYDLALKSLQKQDLANQVKIIDHIIHNTVHKNLSHQRTTKLLKDRIIKAIEASNLTRNGLIHKDDFRNHLVKSVNCCKFEMAH